MRKIDLKGTLREVLIANDIPQEDFSMEGYKEGAICVEKLSEGYLVYLAMDGKKCDTTRCAKLLDACYAMIPRLSTNLREISEIKNNFVDNVILEALEKLGCED